MSEWSVERIWKDFSAELGENLRVVTRYDGTDFETKMREDVRSNYTRDDDQEVVDSTIVNQLGLADSEGVFRAGDLQALVRVFDEAWILSWMTPSSKKSGVIVSIQRNVETTSMDDVEWCLGYLENKST